MIATVELLGAMVGNVACAAFWTGLIAGIWKCTR